MRSAVPCRPSSGVVVDNTDAVRITDPPSAERLRAMIGVRILRRDTGELVALFENPYRLQRLQNDQPELVLRPLLTTTTEHDPSP